MVAVVKYVTVHCIDLYVALLIAIYQLLIIHLLTYYIITSVVYVRVTRHAVSPRRRKRIVKRA